MIDTRLHHGDVMDWARDYSGEPFHALLCDPPYELAFMGKKWDSSGVSFRPETWAALAEHLHPGAFGMAFAGSRTMHRIACAIEDAGLILHPFIGWVYGSGFPKATRIDTQIDKAAGAEREVTGKNTNGVGSWMLEQKLDHRQHGGTGIGYADGSGKEFNITTPATDLAQTWDGWGTALKPAAEFWWLAMKPMPSTYAHNAETYGVAGLWIDGCRVGTDTITQHRNGGGRKFARKYDGNGANLPVDGITTQTQGRWPANLILSESAGALLDAQSGTLASGAWRGGDVYKLGRYEGQKGARGLKVGGPCKASSGGASRFFQHCDYGPDDAEALRFRYCPKASRSERNAGLEDGATNGHPTVKPVAMLEYLCKLTRTPIGGVVQDPFMGSGTTGIAAVNTGRDFIGIELDEDYCEIARRRIEHARQQLPLPLETE